MQINAVKNLTSTKHDIEYFFKANLKLLSSVGFKCSFTEKSEKFEFYHKIPTYIANICGIIVFVLQIYFIVDVIRNNSLSDMQIFSHTVCNLQCIFKGFLTAHAIDNIQRILETLGTCWKKYKPRESDREPIMDRAYQTLLLCKFYLVMAVSAFLALSTRPFITFYIQYLNREATNHTYDFSHRTILMKYPFEIQNVSIHFLLVFVEENFLLMCAIFWSSSDCLFAGVTTHICVQFNVLKYDMSAFNDKMSKGEHFSMIDVINRHKELLRMCYLIEDIFSPIIFSTTLLSALNMCVNVVGVRETITRGYYQETGMYFFLFVGTFLQILFYCTFAESLTEETKSFADTVYNLKWTKKDHKIKFCIQFIIMRCQKPFYCTAYGFFPIGHQQLTSIINTFFSYYMMMETMSS